MLLVLTSNPLVGSNYPVRLNPEGSSLLLLNAENDGSPNFISSICCSINPFYNLCPQDTNE